MPKRFEDGDHTKCNLQDGIFKPGQTVLKSSDKPVVQEKEISYIKPPHSRVTFPSWCVI